MYHQYTSSLFFEVDCSVDGLVFKLFHELVDQNGTGGRSTGSSRFLFIIFTLEEEIGVFEAELSFVIMCCMDNDVLLWSFMSCSNLF